MFTEGSWITATIAANATTSAEIDLGRVYEKAVIHVPALTNCKITVQGAIKSAGTFQNVYDQSSGSMQKVWTSEGEGEFMWVVPLGGLQHLKLYSSVAQGSERTFYVRGTRG